jgi:hypothetical protein
MKLSLETLENRIAAFNLVAPWSSNILTYSFVGEASPESVAAVEASLRAWANVAPLHFTEQPDSGFIGTFREDYPADGSPQIRFHFNQLGLGPFVAGSAFFPGTSGRAGDVFIVGSGSASVILHEIGHSLGLDHSDDPNSIMTRVVSGLARLGNDDVAGIQELYGAGSGSVSPLKRPAPVPSNVFGSFQGEVLSGKTDFDKDGILDTIFAANNAQGHVKILEGTTAGEVHSDLAFTGFGGDVALTAGSGTAAIAAQKAQGHFLSYGNGFGVEASVIAFPGYMGDVELSVVGGKVQIAASAPGGMHVKVFDQGAEVESYIK